MTDYKRLQVLIPDWEGWGYLTPNGVSALISPKAWHCWLAITLMQACKEKGVEFGVSVFIGEREPGFVAAGPKSEPQGDWPQAIIEACAEALENG